MTVIDGYIAAVLDPALHARLEALRAVIREEAPDGEDAISYGLATIDLGRKVVRIRLQQLAAGRKPRAGKPCG